MIELFCTAITASFVDSLNPSAIAQQMLIQAMVKRKQDVWFFILGIGLANMVLGLGIYYGVVAFISDWLTRLFAQYFLWAYTAEALIGVCCLVLGVLLVLKTRKKRQSGEDAETAVKTPAGLSPLSLFLLGAAFCGVELTSALPYFGFLAVVAAYSLAFPSVWALITLYSFVYVLPLILIYFGYNRLKNTSVMKKLERILDRISAYIVPIAVCVIGAYMVYGGIGGR